MKAHDGKISYDNTSRIVTVTPLYVQFNVKAGYVYDAAVRNHVFFFINIISNKK